MTTFTRRKFLQLAAVSAAALGLGAVPVAEGEPAPDTLLGVPIELTDLDEPEAVLIGPVPNGVKEIMQSGYLILPEHQAGLMEILERIR